MNHLIEKILIKIFGDNMNIKVDNAQYRYPSLQYSANTKMSERTKQLDTI